MIWNLAPQLYIELTGDKKYFNQSIQYSTEEKVTPWMGADTAKHYQLYPFHNFGHYELAKKFSDKKQMQLIGYYKEGINRVWKKAEQNAFYRGVPFIWCSNNLNTSFAIQCYLYRQLSGDDQYAELEQACYRLVIWLQSLGHKYGVWFAFPGRLRRMIPILPSPFYTIIRWMAGWWTARYMAASIKIYAD